MAWKASELFVAGVVVAAIVWWRTPGGPEVVQPLPPTARPSAAAAQQLDVRELAMRHAVTRVGLADCKLEPLPKEASDQWFMFLARTDLDAATAGVAWATLIVKGHGLRPTSVACKEIAAKRAEYAAGIVDLAAMAKELEKGR